MADRRNEERPRVQVDAMKDGRTHQSDAEAADINRIMGRWRKAGFQGDPPARLNPRKPVYGDFSSVSDYLTAFNAIQAAKERFDALPARLRRECDNDPAKLIDYVLDPSNEESLREYGLLEVDDQVEAPPAEPAQDPPADPTGAIGE